MTTTRSRKDSTVLAPTDIGDQPVGPYLFLIEGPAGTQAFSVDLTEVEDEVIRGYRTEVIGADTPFGYVARGLVVAVPVRSPWTVIARSAVTFRTLEESMRKQKLDQEQGSALVTEIFGAGTTGAPVSPSSLSEMPSLLPPVGHYI